MWSFSINFKDDVAFGSEGVVPSTIANELSRVTNGTLDGNWHYYLPVKVIDGVDVEVKFVGNENGLSLYIKSIAYMYGRKRLITIDTATVKQFVLFKKTYIKKNKGRGDEENDIDSQDDVYTLRDFIGVLEQIESDINIMKFNKLDGVLYTPDILHPSEQGCVFSVFDDEKSCEIMTCRGELADDCCVCLDSTKTTTLCGHKLCVMCWGKIKKNCRDIPCPICRKNLTNREEIAHLYPNGMATGPDAESEEIDWSDDEEDEEDEQDAFLNREIEVDLDLGFGYDDPHAGIQEFPSITENNIYDYY